MYCGQPGMTQLGGCLPFTQEAAQIRLRHRLGPWKFNCHKSAQPSILRFPDISHGAGAQPFDQLEMLNSAARLMNAVWKRNLACTCCCDERCAARMKIGGFDLLSKLREVAQVFLRRGTFPLI